MPALRKLLIQTAPLPDSLARLNAGKIKAARIAIMAITTNNTISVKAKLQSGLRETLLGRRMESAAIIPVKKFNSSPVAEGPAAFHDTLQFFEDRGEFRFGLRRAL